MFFVYGTSGQMFRGTMEQLRQVLAAVQMRVNLAEFETDVGTTKGPIGPFAFAELRTSQLRTIHRPLWMRPLRTV